MLFTVSIILFIVFFILINIFLIEKKLSKISKGNIINHSENKNTALLIIDMQKDLTLAKGRLTVDTSQTDQIIKNLNNVLKKTHVKGWKVIFIQQIFNKNWLLNFLTNHALLEESTGIEIDDRLIKPQESLYIRKHVRDAFSNPELDQFLSKHEIGHLYISGLDADYCVNATIEAAINRKYKVSVVRDTVGCKKLRNLPKRETKWREIGVQIVDQQSILNS